MKARHGRKVEAARESLAVHRGDKLCANRVRLARTATAYSSDVITVHSKVLGLLRGINLACQPGNEVILGIGDGCAYSKARRAWLAGPWGAFE